MDYLKVSFR